MNFLHQVSIHLYTFVITTNTYKVHQGELPKDFGDLLEDYLTGIEILDQTLYIETAHHLYKLLLKNVQPNSKLIIIPDGKLLYLPFEALLTESVSPQANYVDLPYLVHQCAITYHYSTTLFCQKHQKTKQPKKFYRFCPRLCRCNYPARQPKTASFI